MYRTYGETHNTLSKAEIVPTTADDGWCVMVSGKPASDERTKAGDQRAWSRRALCNWQTASWARRPTKQRAVAEARRVAYSVPHSARPANKRWPEGDSCCVLCRRVQHFGDHANATNSVATHSAPCSAEWQAVERMDQNRTTGRSL